MRGSIGQITEPYPKPIRKRRKPYSFVVSFPFVGFSLLRSQKKSADKLPTMDGQLLIVSADVKKIGDVIGKVLYANIKTHIDGYEIESYNIRGRTVIAVESLKAYGYNVKWNNKERRLDAVSPATSTISGKVALPE